MPALVMRHFSMPTVPLYTILSVALLAMAVMWVQNAIYEEQNLIKLQRKHLNSLKTDENQTLFNKTALDEQNVQHTNDGSEDLGISKNKEHTSVWTYPKAAEGETKPSSSITVSIKRNQQPELITQIAKSILDGEYSLGYGVMWLMMSEPLCLVVSVNAAYCALALVVQIIQSIVFGRLRPVERQHMKTFQTHLMQAHIAYRLISYYSVVTPIFDYTRSVSLHSVSYSFWSVVSGLMHPSLLNRNMGHTAAFAMNAMLADKFWNLVFYKFIFVFGVMDVQSLNEALIWVSWFTVIAFLLLLTKLCKDRFEFLSFSPNTPMFYHWKVIGLLVFLLTCCVVLAVISVTVIFPYPFSTEDGGKSDFHSVLFMLTECVIISVKTIHVLIRYAIHLYDIQYNDLWERKATLVYHVDLGMELMSLSTNFVHHLHMLFFGNIWLSMASLVICMQLRYIFSEIQKRLLRHKNYRRVVANMKAQFPEATKEELEAHEDQCAICWDEMESARKLPCGHLFHSPCLRSWLEQDTSCPTCRKQLGIPGGRRRNGENVINPEVLAEADGAAPNPGTGAMNQGAGPIPRRNFWHFDGSRIASWFPSFSVEVTHTAHGAQAMVTTGANLGENQISNSQLDAMLREVQEIFPQIPSQIIRNDLLVTGSVEATTERILDGRSVGPGNQILRDLPQTGLPQMPRSPGGVSIRTFPTAPGATLRRRHRASVPDDSENMQVASANDQQAPSQNSPAAPARDNSPPPVERANSSASPSDPGRFASAPEERVSALQSRRESLMRTARMRYLERSRKRLQNQPSSTDVIAQVVGAQEENSLNDVPSTSRSRSGHLEDDSLLSSGLGHSVTSQDDLTAGHSDSEFSEESLG